VPNGVTSGCGGASYCPAQGTTREQMAVFVLRAKEGKITRCAQRRPCSATRRDSPSVPGSKSRARRNGCGGEPRPQSLSREQMALFVLRTLEPGEQPAACVPPNLFDDVPETSPFCPFIEELARRGVVGGCAQALYCPAGDVSREQMAVFLSVTFGLGLYGP
jgi:hypothetical protein